MTKVNLYLDDVRDCPEGFLLARNAIWMMHLLDTYRGNIGAISLDHDLGDEYDLNGLHVVDYIVSKNRWSEQIFLHIANPVGRENMYRTLMRYKPDWVKVHRSPMVIG